jgi:hypothetical protein
VISLSYASLRSQLHYKAKEIAEAMQTLISRVIESHGLPSEKVTLRVRTAKSAYYKPYQLNLTFKSHLFTILHEIKHHLDYVKDGAIRTYKESLEKEFFAAAFASEEFNKWIDEYSDNILGLQVDYAELCDKIRGVRRQ